MTKIRDPKPEIQRLESLVRAIQSGEIKLPKFQRPFVWSKKEMLDLLDSIYNGYPIGSILLWHSSERLKSERAIEGFQVANDSIDTYPTDYLLDGQQRLTTLCGSLFWSGKESHSIWRIFFDLETEQFVHHKGDPQPNLFPLNKLLSTQDFIKQCMSFESSNNAKKYYKNAENLLASMKDYKIAVVKIGDTPLDEVGPIFERINSTGRKLTMVDLMRAATWKDGFDLGELIQETIDLVKQTGFGDISDTDVLRNIAAAAGFGVNKDDIDRLRERSAMEISAASLTARDGTMQALKFLRDKVSLEDISYLPYGLQLAHLVEFFRLQPNPSISQQETLSKWFWWTSVSRYFAGSSTGQNSRDLENIRSFARGNNDALPIPSKVDITQFLFDPLNLRNATSTAFGLLLKWKNPKFSLNGEIIDSARIKILTRQNFSNLTRISDIGVGRNIFFALCPYDSIEYKWIEANGRPEVLGAHYIEISMFGDQNALNLSFLMNRRAELIASDIEYLTGCSVEYDNGEVPQLLF